MALTKISGGVIQQPIDVGIITATSGDFSGIVTASSINATSANFSGNVSIAGTLTYEDVTNIDSVGLITARSGIHVTGGLVGIGTDNPETRLDVWGADINEGNAYGQIIIRDTAAYNASPISGIIFKGEHTPGFAAYFSSIYGGKENSSDGSYAGYLALSTRAQGSTAEERLRITSSGNVGIGLTDPTSKLNINPGGNSFFKFGQDADNPKLEIFRSTGTLPNSHYGIEIQQILQDLTISTAGPAALGSHSFTEKLRITSDGNIGIGTDNPGSTLDVRGSGLFGYDAVNTTSIIKGFSNSHNSANRGAKIRFGLNDGSFGGVEVENVQGGNPSHNSQTVHLVTHNGGIKGDIRAVTARYDGNVGIGSDSPDASLVVDSGITPTTIKITSNTESSIDFNDKGGTPKRYKIGTNISSNDGQFEIRDMTANAERLRITSTGNVGIGTDNPTAPIHFYRDALTSDSTRFNLLLQDSSSYAEGVGGGINFGFKYDSAGNLINRSACIAGIKENGTDGNYASALTFHTTQNAASTSEKMRITSNGDFRITQTPGRYTIDTTNGATTIANGATVDFASASGMLVVNNWANGNVTIYICGGGTVTVVANTGSNVGSFTYNAGIAGYRWTNNYGSNAVFGFFFVRTRTTA